MASYRVKTDAPGGRNTEILTEILFGLLLVMAVDGDLLLAASRGHAYTIEWTMPPLLDHVCITVGFPLLSS